MESIALMLMLWISDNTDYNTADIPLPAIVEMTREEITTEMYTDHPDRIPDSGVDPRINALYSHEDGTNGTIYIVDADLNADAQKYDDPLENPIFQEKLLHELIHHTQRLSGELHRMPCRNFGERQAYLLGGEFLRRQNVADPMPNRNFWAHVYSRC